MCKCFGGDDGIEMQSLNAETWYEPFGTSLRMSDLGYSNQNQSRINISLNSLQEYTRDLGNATTTPEPAYEKFGVNVDGEYQQLNANRLQIENEYYSPVRPKRVARSGEQPTAALQRGGVEYIEIRSLDININDPSGINQNTMRFIEAFLIYCLVEDSPPLDATSTIESKRNQAEMAKRGRDPSFRLYRDGAELTVANWAHEIVDKVSGIAGLIDQSEGGNSYREAIHLMRDLIDEPALTPSARLLDELRDADCSFFEFAMSVARSHKDYFAAIAPLSGDQQKKFEDEVSRSIQCQREIEQSDEISFDEYLEKYSRSI